MDIVVILMKDEFASNLKTNLKLNLTKQSYEAGLTQIKSKLILKISLKKYPNTFEQYWDIF
jgi:hypothetical protein